MLFNDIENYEYLGVFDNTSDKLFISDPCYDANTWCVGYVAGKKGLYHSFALYADTVDGDQIAALLVVHDDHISNIDFRFPLVHRMRIHSDSNTVGIWDKDAQSKMNEEDLDRVHFAVSGDYEERGTFCPLRPLAGVISEGAVVSTGDGEPFMCFTSRSPGDWVLVRFVKSDEIHSVISYEDYSSKIISKQKEEKELEKRTKESLKRLNDLLRKLKMEVLPET